MSEDAKFDRDFHAEMRRMAREQHMGILSREEEETGNPEADMWRQAAEANARRADANERRFNTAAVFCAITWVLFIGVIVRDILKR